jgi:hypothetical protein
MTEKYDQDIEKDPSLKMLNEQINDGLWRDIAKELTAKDFKEMNAVKEEVYSKMYKEEERRILSLRKELGI